MEKRGERLAGRASLCEIGVGGDDDADDDSKETQGRTENLNDQDLDKQLWTHGISERTTAAHDTDAHTAEEVAEADRETSSKEGVSSVKVLGNGVDDWLELGGEDDGDNGSVDGDGLTEDDTDQVLGLNSGLLDGSSEQAGSSDPDAPSSPNDGEGDGETSSDAGVGERADARKDFFVSHCVVWRGWWVFN